MMTEDIPASSDDIAAEIEDVMNRPEETMESILDEIGSSVEASEKTVSEEKRSLLKLTMK